MYWRERKRIPLKEGTEFTINGITIVNDDKNEDVLQGSSCLVYRGHLKNNSSEGIVENSVIIKEFYPDIENAEVVLDIERDVHTDLLVVSELTKEKSAFHESYEQFCQGFSFQKELSSSEAMEIAVKPLVCGTAGDGYYVISDIHRGMDLKKAPPKTLEEKLSVAVGIAETMSILHEAGYVMLDFKPENFLWIRKPNIIKIIDTDSLVPYRKNADISKLKLFVNQKMQSPEVQFLKAAIESGISDRELERKKKFYLKPTADLYVLGKYLYELFWEQALEATDFKNVDKEDSRKQFFDLYKKEENTITEKLELVVKGLWNVLSRLLVSDLLERMESGYQNAKALRKDLNEICLVHTSVNYIPRKEIAKANATFAGYHMLQKYPLYEYANVVDGIRQLKVVIAGNHAMRKEILSAIICIGQMLDSTLQIHLVGEDVLTFWSEYLSPKYNEELSNAVTWSVNGKSIKDTFDEKLVSQALAHVNLVSENIEQYLSKKDCRYYVLLSENTDMNEQWLKILTDKPTADQIFVGCIGKEREETLSENFIYYPISAQCYSENYNENIFNEKIFQMGLMVHAYYCGCLDNIDSTDMEQLKKEFSADMYNVESSERCALHAMYKMACVGMQGNIPRKALRFEKKMDSEPETLEALAWLEHLSWTASLLTTGARREKIEDLDSYGYKGKNDWKNREDPAHMGHPLLVESRKEISNVDWTKKENVGELDGLDYVSHKIYYWYIENKETFHTQLKKILDKLETKNSEQQMFLKQMHAVIDRCIDGMGKKAMEQDATGIKEWKTLIREVENCFEQKEVIKELQNAMRPIIDSYKDRDYKHLDRKMVYAAASIVG